MKIWQMSTSLLLVAALSTGCEYIDKIGKERPDATQREAIGDVFAHVGGIGSVLDDPVNASDGDLLDMFEYQPYLNLVEPDGATLALALERRQQNVTDEGCIVVDESTATFDCDIPVPPEATCNVNGSGSRTGSNNYSGSATLSGEACDGNIDLAANFSLTGTSGSGTLTVTGRGSTQFDVRLNMPDNDPLEFCENGLPNAGKMEISVDFPALSVSDAKTVVFGPDCGLAVFE